MLPGLRFRLGVLNVFSRKASCIYGQCRPLDQCNDMLDLKYLAVTSSLLAYTLAKSNGLAIKLQNDVIAKFVASYGMQENLEWCSKLIGIMY